MGLARRYQPLILNSAMALAGLVVAGALVRIATVEDRGAGSGPQVTLPLAADRLAFVRPGVLLAVGPIPSRVALKPSISSADGDEVGTTASWSTDTHVEARSASPPWRFTVLPSLRTSAEAVKPGVVRRTVALKTRLAEITPAALVRLAVKFEAAHAVWPPADVVLLAIKDEKALELHARAAGGGWKLIHRYRVLAASGGPGPKLLRGDKQVPEGVYAVPFLNPNSAFHLSMRVSYPNAFDRQMAALDGRKDLGGDIMVHGKNLSAGCLAVGDEAIEELFVLAAQIGLSHVKLIISPTDFREKGLSAQAPGQPVWLPKLYAELASAMAEFKQPRSTGLMSFFGK